MKKRYVYRILNKITQKSYIGSTITIDKRKWGHFSQLRHNKHHSCLLQRSFNIHKEEAFDFIILEEFEGDNNSQWEREQYYMNIFKSYDSRFGYNIAKDARATVLGMTEEQRKKMGRKVSKKHKGKIPKNLFNIQKNRKRVIIVSEQQNNSIKEYPSGRDTAKALGIDYRNIPHYIGRTPKYGKLKGITINYKYPNEN